MHEHPLAGKVADEHAGSRLRSGGMFNCRGLQANQEQGEIGSAKQQA
jgi:hypothetical protein